MYSRRDFAKEMIQCNRESICTYRNLVATLKRHLSHAEERKWDKETIALLKENISLAEERIIKDKEEIKMWLKQTR